MLTNRYNKKTLLPYNIEVFYCIKKFQRLVIAMWIVNLHNWRQNVLILVCSLYMLLRSWWGKKHQTRQELNSPCIETLEGRKTQNTIRFQMQLVSCNKG